MEERHREVIQRNYAILVEQCNIEHLLPVLEQKRVFPRQTIDKYMLIDDNLRRKRDVFLDIQTRGPRAFSNLVTSLHETGQYSLAKRLDPTFSFHVQPKKQARPFQLPLNADASTYNTQQIREFGQNNLHNKINLNLQPLKLKVTFSNRFYDQDTLVPTYSTHSKKRGSVLVINIIKYHNDLHMERKGAEVDGSNLFDLFTQMGFFVEYHTDLSATKITDVILQFKSSPELVGCDMIFVIVMAHGTINKDVNVSEIIGSDNNVVSTKWIEEQFTNRECKILQNKPKIFMYQMCRGDTPDFGAVQSNIENDSGIRMASASRVMLRSCSDMLIAHSTLPGNVSHRDVYLGTWYISLFCKIMMDHAHDTNLEDIFKLIDYQLSVLRSGKNTMQTSMYTNIGFKTCFVHPGIYLDCNEIRMINEGLTPEVNDNISL